MTLSRLAAASAYPRARPGTARASTSRSSRSTPTASSSACSTLRTTAEVDSVIAAARAHRPRVALLSARVAARASSTATASTARTSPRTVTASTRTSCSSTRTPRRSRAPSAGRRALRLHASATRAPTSPSTSATAPPAHAEVRRHRPGVHLGRRPAARTRRGTRRVIYEAHVRGFTEAAPRGARGAARHIRRARPPTRSSSTCVARRDGRRADARAPVRRRQASWSQGLTNYWGYNSIGFFAPDVALRRRRDSGSRCTSSRRW